MTTTARIHRKIFEFKYSALHFVFYDQDIFQNIRLTSYKALFIKRQNCIHPNTSINVAPEQNANI
jgi:hypothetical protein